MTDYLINILLQFIPYLTLCALLALFSSFKNVDSIYGKIVREVTESSEDEEDFYPLSKILRGAALVVFVVGLFISVTSPSITYKNKAANVEAIQYEQMQIQKNEMLETDSSNIVDNALKPKHTVEQRQKRFDELVDYKD